MKLSFLNTFYVSPWWSNKVYVHNGVPLRDYEELRPESDSTLPAQTLEFSQGAMEQGTE